MTLFSTRGKEIAFFHANARLSQIFLSFFPLPHLRAKKKSRILSFPSVSTRDRKLRAIKCELRPHTSSSLPLDLAPPACGCGHGSSTSSSTSAVVAAAASASSFSRLIVFSNFFCLAFQQQFVSPATDFLLLSLSFSKYIPACVCKTARDENKWQGQKTGKNGHLYHFESEPSRVIDSNHPH